MVAPITMYTMKMMGAHFTGGTGSGTTDVANGHARGHICALCAT
jgi:hypothetical protein